jgi:predicted nucleic acid-binding protein
MPFSTIIPEEVRNEVDRNLKDFSKDALLDLNYVGEVREEFQSLISTGTINVMRPEAPKAIIQKFSETIRKELSHSPFELSFHYGEAYAIFLARQINASAIFSDDAVVPFVANHVKPGLRVEGSPYLVKYGFLKKLITFSAFVRLLFDLQEKAGYRFMSLYDPRKRRVFDMYKDNILEGVHLVKYEVNDYLKEGRYKEIIDRLDGDGF